MGGKSMNNIVYGFKDYNGAFVEYSYSFGATKRKANKEQIDQILAMNTRCLSVWIAASKTNGIWSK